MSTPLPLERLIAWLKADPNRSAFLALRGGEIAVWLQGGWASESPVKLSELAAALDAAKGGE